MNNLQKNTQRDYAQKANRYYLKTPKTILRKMEDKISETKKITLHYAIEYIPKHIEYIKNI